MAEPTIIYDIEAMKRDMLLTQDYLRRTMRKLKDSIDLIDPEHSDAEDFEDEVNKLIADIKRKKLV